MSEENSGGCAKGLGVFAVLALVGVTICGAAGALLYFNWDKTGLPSLATLRSKVEDPDANPASGGTTSASGVAASSARATLASAPLQANAASYAQWTGRGDVLVLVDYYADW